MRQKATWKRGAGPKEIGAEVFAAFQVALHVEGRELSVPEATALWKKLLSPDFLLEAAETEARRFYEDESGGRSLSQVSADDLRGDLVAAVGIGLIARGVKRQLDVLDKSSAPTASLQAAKLAIALGISLGSIWGRLGIGKIVDLAEEGMKGRQARSTGTLKAYGSRAERDAIYRTWRAMWAELRPSSPSVASTCENISRRCEQQGIVSKVTGKPFTARSIRRVVAPKS